MTQWNDEKIRDVIAKYGEHDFKLCSLRGADALAFQGEKYVTVVEGSIVADTTPEFNASETFIQDYRRISEIPDEEAIVANVMHGRVNFRTFQEAAQFVGGTLDASSRDWIDFR